MSRFFGDTIEVEYWIHPQFGEAEVHVEWICGYPVPMGARFDLFCPMDEQRILTEMLLEERDRLLALGSPR